MSGRGHRLDPNDWLSHRNGDPDADLTRFVLGGLGATAAALAFEAAAGQSASSSGGADAEAGYRAAIAIAALAGLAALAAARAVPEDLAPAAEAAALDGHAVARGPDG